MGWFRFIFITIILCATFGFVIFHLLRFFFTIQVSSSTFKKDVEQLKVKLGEIKKVLIPIDSESIQLLSFDKEEDFVEDKVSYYKEGSFTSIYHEPMIAYGFKTYLARPDKGILLAETSNDTYEFYISAQSTRVRKNDIAFGVINSEGNIHDMEGGLLAKIQTGLNQLLPILRNEKSIAVLNNPVIESTGLSRAFNLIDTKDSDDIELIVLLSTLLAVQVD